MTKTLMVDRNQTRGRSSGVHHPIAPHAPAAFVLRQRRLDVSANLQARSI